MFRKNQMHTVHYTTESQLRHPWRLLRQMWREALSSWPLVKRLALRDISAQYRQTLLGYFWALLPPLITSIVWIFLNYAQVVTVDAGNVPYPVYAFTGTMFWQLFMDALSAPLTQVNANRALLTRVNFTREALVFSGILQVLFSFAIKLIVLFGILFFFHIQVTWTAALLVLPVFGLLLIGTTMGIFLVPVGFLYKDIQNGFVMIIGLLMYFTPVVYPPPASGTLAALMNLNPLTPMFNAIRAMLYQGLPSLSTQLILVVCATTLFTLACWILYRLALPIITERMEA